MSDLPVMLSVRGRRCVIVGGGGVALRRARALLEAGATIVVIAPEHDAELATLPVTLERRSYQPGDLADALLVVIATDDVTVNGQVAADARAQRVLVNRADDPEAGDVAVPAHAHHGPVTIAVHTSGISAAAAAAIRRELSTALAEHWPTLLQIVAPYRQLIQDRFPDAADRRARLLRLTSPEAIATLQQHGPAALRDWCERAADQRE